MMEKTTESSEWALRFDVVIKTIVTFL